MWPAQRSDKPNMNKDSQPPSDPALDSESGPTVPFHEAELDWREGAILTNGLIYDLPDNRRVEVWRVKDEEGFCIRIFRQANDGKTSKLLFALTPKAAHALAAGLMRQLNL